MAIENCKYVYALWRLKKPQQAAYENASCEPSKATYSAKQLIKDFFKGFKNEWE